MTYVVLRKKPSIRTFNTFVTCQNTVLKWRKKLGWKSDCMKQLMKCRLSNSNINRTHSNALVTKQPYTTSYLLQQKKLIIIIILCSKCSANNNWVCKENTSKWYLILDWRVAANMLSSSAQHGKTLSWNLSQIISFNHSANVQEKINLT